jgi:hypothetical protein
MGQNKFIGFLETIGRDFKKALPWIASMGEAAVSAFLPGVSAIFNQTVAAVVTAEQSAAAIGKQNGTGPQKLAAVVQLMGPLIAVALADAGKPNDTAAVEAYVSAIVTVLNTTPATTGT